ncbi:hypothetical protein XENORESO_020583 [Xenotaenia resolanae]|uniref:Uncharacterized protein n=1 Tax=Xenotaenia resolanae TaxID=208358 RepID=A0ABV0VZV8_9TELE
MIEEKVMAMVCFCRNQTNRECIISCYIMLNAFTPSQCNNVNLTYFNTFRNAHQPGIEQILTVNELVPEFTPYLTVPHAFTLYSHIISLFQYKFALKNSCLLTIHHISMAKPLTPITQNPVIIRIQSNSATVTQQ